MVREMRSERKQPTITKRDAIAIDSVDTSSVYEFYRDIVFPAIQASLPLLFHRIGQDMWTYLRLGTEKVARFLLPGFVRTATWQAPNLILLLEKVASNSTVHDFMMRNFDTNHDGHISPSELINMTEILAAAGHAYPRTWFEFVSREWPLMDWKVGVFIWRSCSGLLLLIAVASLLPGRMHGVVGKLLRWPVLGLTYFMIGVELSVYIVIRMFIRIIEATFANSKHRRLRHLMRNAQSYDEWYGHASVLDVSQGRHQWQQFIHDQTSVRYNWAFIKALISDMRKARATNDSFLALAVLQQCTRKNVGGIMSEESFSFTNTGEPKFIVQEFIHEVATTLRWVTTQCSLIDENDSVDSSIVANEIDYEKKLQKKVRQEKKKIWSSVVTWATQNYDHTDDESSEIPPDTRYDHGGNDLDTTVAVPQRTLSHGDNKTHLPPFHKEKVIAFLKRARAAYGRTALCLSGGAMMGLYHFGIIKALLEMGCLPNIISGTSAGSVVGAIVCTRTDDEIRRDLDPAILATKLKCFSLPWSERVKNMWTKGCMLNYEDWRELIRWFTMGDMTFAEAFHKTGRVFCITLSATTKKAPAVLINHITAPNVVIASAVIASAAVPGLIHAVRLEVKRPDGTISFEGEQDQTYWDGSIEQDIPTTGLAEMLNCQFFIAAQCNPHIVPFFYNCCGGVGRPSRWSSGTRETAWRGGFLLSALEQYLKSDMKAKFQFLNDIEAAVGFTSTMMIQHFVGSTTIVPQVSLIDYFQLMSDPSYDDIIRYEKGGAIAAYEHCAMIRLHYHVPDALDECLRKLETGDAAARKNRGLAAPKVLAHQLAGITADPDGVCTSTDASSSGEEEDADADAEQNGFDETEAYVSGRTRI